MLGVGALLTLVFGALALLIAVRADDRLKGVGVAIGVWLVTAVVYDGVVLLLAATFADYPLERPMLGAMLANPVDLARVVLLLRFDVAALLGLHRGRLPAVLRRRRGTAIALGALLLWVIGPLALGRPRLCAEGFLAGCPDVWFHFTNDED